MCDLKSHRNHRN